ncbi:cyclic AMP response element-binding protein A isoform X2 [Drosophila pseudoobscura]|uniref:Cyclic AMP response element-binding protein A isoform X2 n=1 Tax=Drosophila pseudoobscura pseudoobscura TaxID=46245 RepID=A0A6I8VK08_DROPS|nr:cyclic AMP response element-binding protein A isoform X2 [Drosophila pseudoobscura]
MEFYDGDLKDIWDSDLDPESLKISSDHDMHDWLFDRDVKDPTVILNDKLISDALLNGTLPIKTEHSYSLSSDVDSLPDSPKSLHPKIEDMDDECFPAISLKSATSVRATIDPKCLTLHPQSHTPATHSSRVSCSPALSSELTTATATLTRAGLQTHAHHLQSGSNSNSNSSSHSHVVAAMDHYQLPHLYDNDCSSSLSSIRDGSISPDICSDIEIDESAIKDEPMSPDSSCPASPNSQASSSQQHQLSLNLAHLQTEMLFEQKHGGLLLTSSSSSNNHLIKSQQRQHQHPLLGQGDLIMAKMEIKSEKQNTSNSSTTSSSSSGKSHAYGIPLTPPSSLPSDDSEGNLTPEHLFSPLSPNASVSISVANAANGESSTMVRRNVTGITRSASCGGSGPGTGTGSNTSTTTTRQPIHTPLISSQPKGSTGTLLLTEEEKRTLLAEGYPIPQKLPLTKAEEKSLKKIRRKIKNKISAQESRRKKKEYMDQLERRVEILVTENHDYKKRLESLEETNANLLSQLHKLQALVSKHNVKKS